MRIRIFTEIEVDEPALVDHITREVPDAQPEELPRYVANIINGLVQVALPHVTACGSIPIPELRTTSILSPERARIVL